MPAYWLRACTSSARTALATASGASPALARTARSSCSTGTGASAARSLWKSPPVKIDVNPSEGWKLVAVKKGFDDFNQAVFADGSVVAGKALWKYGDAGLIDGVVVNGSAKTIGWLAGVVRHVQSGYLYHYAFAMIIGLLGLLTWIVVR